MGESDESPTGYNLRLGDQVKLGPRGPLVRLDRYDTNRGVWMCSWFDGTKLMQEQFTAPFLEAAQSSANETLPQRESLSAHEKRLIDEYMMTWHVAYVTVGGVVGVLLGFLLTTWTKSAEVSGTAAAYQNAMKTSNDSVIDGVKRITLAGQAAEAAKLRAETAQQSAELANENALGAQKQLTNFLGDTTTEVTKSLLDDKTFREEILRATDANNKKERDDIKAEVSRLETRLSSLLSNDVIIYLTDKRTSRIDKTVMGSTAAINDVRHRTYLSVNDLHVGGGLSVNRRIAAQAVYTLSLPEDLKPSDVTMLNGEEAGK